MVKKKDYMIIRAIKKKYKRSWAHTNLHEEEKDIKDYNENP